MTGNNGNTSDNEPVVVMVTGGTGLIGHGLQWAITEGGMGKPNEKWIFLSSKDANLTVEDDIKALYEKHKPTHVIHLAAMVGGLFRNMRQPAEFFHDNILMNTYMLHYAHVYGVKKAISFMSSCVFPDGIRCPMVEEDLHAGPPHQSNFAYAYAKRMIDIQNRAYHSQHNDCFTAIIPVNVFGPHDNFSIEDGHVIPGLLHKVILAEKNNTPLPVWGTGKPLRQFIYSRDLGRILVWMIRNYDSVEPLLTVDENCEVSIKELVNTVVDGMKFKGKVEFDTTRADGQYRKECSNARLRKHLPDFKFTPMKQAMNETCDWFRANYDTCRK